MPAKKTTGGINVADVETRLPKTYFVMRGHVERAFGLTKEEMTLLIGTKTFVPEYPFGPKTRARFVRSKLLAQARKWESPA
jgi:hypothetical protein